ncbi:MAG: hypothetical protein C0407_01515 [Desulfobacca sp.]|nr:hypothetical protein [Desulfobacca sp.]
MSSCPWTRWTGFKECLLMSDKPRALVTGATGFLGGYLVKELRRQRWEVVCLTRRPVRPREDSGIATFMGELNDPDDLKSALKKAGEVDVYFHLGATMPHEDLETRIVPYARTNVLGTAVLLDNFVAAKGRSFVYASGVYVIGFPKYIPINEDHPISANTNYYLTSKLAGEQFCEVIRQQTGGLISSLRIASPYGPGMPMNTVLPHFVRQALDGRQITLLGSGSRTQTFVHARDVVQSFLKAAEGPGGIFNVGGLQAITMKGLAEKVIELIPSTKSAIIYKDEKDPQEGYDWVLDLTKATQQLGFTPEVTLETGLAEYIDSVRSGQRYLPWWSDR